MSYFGIEYSENIYDYLPREDGSDDDEGTIFPGSGVCDSPEQLARRFPGFSGDVYMLFVYRFNQQCQNGWCWEGKGDYYGEFNISSIDYLYQATGKKGRPKIDFQCVFTNKKPENMNGYRTVFLDHGKVV